MAQEKPNRLAEWLLILREQGPIVRQRLLVWYEACREEPALIWETPAVRYATYSIVGLVLVTLAARAASWMAVPPPEGARDRATTADYHVLCSNPDCGQHFVIHRKFGFDAFPVRCPTCRKETGVRARKCFSATCQGLWRAPLQESNGLRCPVCRERME